MPDFFPVDERTGKRSTQSQVLGGDVEAQIRALRDHLFSLGGGKVVTR
jgi:hypothetical protein